MTGQIFTTPAHWAEHMANIKVGDEVVIFTAGYPCHHNSKHSPAHPCRGRVLKRGTKLLHIESTGAPWKIRLDGTAFATVALIPAAKAHYEADFMAHRAYRTVKFVRQCVESL